MYDYILLELITLLCDVEPYHWNNWANQHSQAKEDHESHTNSQLGSRMDLLKGATTILTFQKPDCWPGVQWCESKAKLEIRSQAPFSFFTHLLLSLCLYTEECLRGETVRKHSAFPAFVPLLVSRLQTST